MPHAFAEAGELIVKSKPVPDPAVDICCCIMMPERIRCGCSVIGHFRPYPPEIFLHPCMWMRGVPWCREKIFPRWEPFPDCAVIAAHQVCHAVMQGNVMLVVAFGISDVEYPVSHIHIRTFQQPCFSSTYAACCKEAGRIPVVMRRMSTFLVFGMSGRLSQALKKLRISSPEKA